MKRILLFFLIGLSIGRMHSQTFNIFYPIDFHSPPYNYLPNAYPDKSFEVLNENGEIEYLMFCDGDLESPSTTSLNNRIFSIRFSENGNYLNHKTYSSNLYENQFFFNTQFNNGMTRNHNGEITGVLVTRTTPSEMNQILDLTHYLARFDDGGNLLDTVRIHYPDDGYEFRSYVMREDLRDSTYMIIGGFRTQAEMPATGGLLKGMIAKVDSLGNVLWWNDVPNTSFGEDIVMAPFGQYCASFQHQTEDDCGPNNTTGSNTKIVVCTFNATGIEKDRITMDNYCSNEIVQLSILDENHVVIAGTHGPLNWQGDPFFWDATVFSQVIEIDNIGWMYEVGEENVYYTAPSLRMGDFTKLSCTGGFVLAGNRRYIVNDERHGFLYRLDSSLGVQWQRGYRYFEIEGDSQPVYRIVDVSELSDCGLLVTGWIDNTSASLINNQVTPWLFRTDEYGCLEPGCQLVNAEEQAVGLDGTVRVFPNPANTWMKLEFTFPEHFRSQFSAEDFRLNVYSVDGKMLFEQMIPIEQILHRGHFEMNTSAWPAGTYLIHLSQGNLWIDSVQGLVTR